MIFAKSIVVTHTHTHLFEQTLSSGTHSHGCWGISPSESLIQWYSIHRAHFIAVVYSRLALKRSGANSQAPFRLNSSVKNSWQYLQKTIQTNPESIEWIHKSKHTSTTCTHLQRTRFVCTNSLCGWAVASVENGFFMLAHDSRFASERIKLNGSQSNSDCIVSGLCSCDDLMGSCTAVNWTYE